MKKAVSEAAKTDKPIAKPNCSSPFPHLPINKIQNGLNNAVAIDNKEFEHRKIEFKEELPVKISYKKEIIGIYYFDFLIENKQGRKYRSEFIHQVLCLQSCSEIADT